MQNKKTSKTTIKKLEKSRSKAENMTAKKKDLKKSQKYHFAMREWNCAERLQFRKQAS